MHYNSRSLSLSHFDVSVLKKKTTEKLHYKDQKHE